MTPLAIRKITSWGVTHAMAIDEARGITLCNQISLLGGVVSFLLAILHGTLVAWNAVSLISFFVSVSFLVPLACNAYGLTLFSRILLSLYLPTCVMLISIISKLLSNKKELDFEGVYYSFHFFLIVTAIGTIGLFERTKAKWGYLASTYLAVLICSFDLLHSFFGVGYYQTGHTDPNYYFSTVTILLAYAALITGILIIRQNIEKNERALLFEIEERKRVELEIRKAQE